MKSFFLHFLLACSLLSEASGQQAKMDSLMQLSSDKINVNDLTGATEYLLAAQKLAEANNTLPILCRIQVSLGKIGILKENNQATQAAVEQGFKYCSACQDTINLAKLFMQNGVLKADLLQYDSAIIYFKHCADYYLLKKDSAGFARALSKVGNILEMEGHYKEAQTYYQKFYAATQKGARTLDFLTANIYLTGNYTYLKQLDKALYHNNIVLNISKKLEANYEYGEALRNEALIYNAKGEYALAFKKMEYFAHYYQDTLMGKMQLDQAEEMKVKYEAEKKETQIALQEAQLGRERFRLWVLVGGLIATLLAGGMLFRLTRQLRKRNQEKEFLIKEIHHRVKNNLQILSSLLHLQSRQITDDTALHAVREGQNRVDAMGLIHQKLYMGDNVAKVEMKEYLNEFGRNMLDSFGIEDNRISIEYDLEPLYLDVDTAIPLGLIINELVTNALKYAFPDQRSGIIYISLWENEQNQLCLKVSDNGVGQANARKDDKSTSFGTNLVQMLSKKLKGSPEVLTLEAGYATQILFEKWA